MKKKILLPLLALLFCAIGYAQEYKMVIELNDGTKITLNTNDVKELSFLEGELVVSEGSLTEMINNISQQSNDNYNSLSSSIIEIKKQNATDKEELLIRINELEDKLDSHINNGGNSEVSSNPLVGTWYIEKESKGYKYYYELTYNADYTCKWWRYRYEGDNKNLIDSKSGTYKIDGDQLTIIYDGETPSTKTFTVSGNTMTTSEAGGSTWTKK